MFYNKIKTQRYIALFCVNPHNKAITLRDTNIPFVHTTINLIFKKKQKTNLRREQNGHTKTKTKKEKISLNI